MPGCSLRNLLCFPGKLRVGKPFLGLICPEKNESPRKQYIKEKILAGILQKQRQFVASFVYKIVKIPVTGPVIFQTCMGDWLAGKQVVSPDVLFRQSRFAGSLKSFRPEYEVVSPES